mgnify:FL=1
MSRLITTLLFFSSAIEGKELLITSSKDWEAWDLPGDALVIENGSLGPGLVRRNIDAVANATNFGGGIRSSGSDISNSFRLIDGDVSTSWSPDLTATSDEAWIEVDLGRVVSAQKIELHFSTAGVPLEFFTIWTSDGEPSFNNANSVIPGTLRYNGSTSYSFNTKHTITVDFDKKPLQFIRIEANRTQSNPNVSLSELHVESIGDNISLGIWDRGGNVSVVSEVGSSFGREIIESSGISSTLVDGDITSYWGTVHRGGSGAQLERQFGQFELDLGALFWIDLVRMLGDGSGIAPGRRGGTFNYLWYQFYVSDGARAVDGSLQWELMAELPANPNNLQGIVHFEENFPLKKVRFLRLFFPMSDGIMAFNGRIGTTAEWQVFGRGHPAKATTQSPIFDLRSQQHITALHWKTQSNDGARIEIRSRTGNNLEEEYLFYDKNGKEVTPKRYGKLIPSFRGAIDTLRTIGNDWSTWSQPYKNSGQLFLSPAPRQYLQLDMRFVSENPFSSTSIDEVRIEYHQPLAQITKAEIFPLTAKAGQLGKYTFYLHSTIAKNSRGFDQILINSSASILVNSVSIGGEIIPNTTQRVKDGILITLENPINVTSLIEINFESTLYINQTRYNAFLFNSKLGEAVRQPVDSGDATSSVQSNVTYITLPTNTPLIEHFTLSNRFISPNGDEINDTILISFDLLRMIEPRPMQLDIFDIAGNHIATIADVPVQAGRLNFTWDGRSNTGRIVKPGIYIIQFRIISDSGEQILQRSVNLAY